MFLSCIYIFLLLGPVPVCAGMLFYKSRYTLINAYVYGWMLMLAAFEVLAVPMVFLKASLGELTIAWAIMIAFLGIFGLYRGRKAFLEWRNAKRYLDFQKAIFFLLCIIQILLVVALQHSDADDNYFIGIANTSLSTDTLLQYDAYTGQLAESFPLRYVFSPFPLFWASVSKITGVHPAILAHTIFPIILISLVYLIVYKISFQIFSESHKALLFCNIMAVLMLFGNYSIYTVSSFMLFRIWQGKAIVASIILPLLVLWFMNEDDRGIREFLMLLVIVLAGCGASSMGIVLQLLLLFSYGVVSVFRKKWKWVLQIFLASIPCFALSLAYIIASGR